VKALAHPLRLRILGVLEERTASPSEIATELDAPLTHVSYHVRQLAELGVVKLVRKTPVRGAIEHHYRMEARPSISDEAWRGAPEVAKQALIGAVLGQISTQVNASAAEAGFSRDGSHLTRFPLELDAEGWREASKVFGELAARLERIQSDAKKRSARRHDTSAAVAVLMLFEAAADRKADVKADGRKAPRRRRARSRVR
jgi:DNA-binding transcriptional ArsR family regulator